MTDHSNSPFLTGEVTKRGPSNLKALVAPYKGGTQKARSSAPLQARWTKARLDRKQGKTNSPLGNG